ncbi:MAG: PspC domain-containing protein [Candidatus Zambryskibacteria bacterium]|nr:PspC domain-containing protein [Candidatus Zambryskibacteria bacterium]
MTKKRLYKSDIDKVFAGVIGGIAEYFDMDPTILRLLYILIAVLTGLMPAVIGYIIAVLIVPKKPLVHHMEHTESEKTV